MISDTWCHLDRASEAREWRDLYKIMILYRFLHSLRSVGMTTCGDANDQRLATNKEEPTMDWTIRKAENGLTGDSTVPSDKSISHRAIMLSSLSEGTCVISNFLLGEDCMSTLNAFRSLGVDINVDGDTVTVIGKGKRALSKPFEDLDLGNSGTTMRVLSGILAGQGFETTLTGDESLSTRPMKRIIEPLTLMGADIKSANANDRPPLTINPAKGGLRAIDYKLPVASAQVKSCVLLAGLFAEGQTMVTEPFVSRDHTERMLDYFSADIEKEGLVTKVTGKNELCAKDLTIPGDISSAAFFIVAALLVEGSELIIKGVGVNSTRIGIINVLKRMGAAIEIINEKDDYEPIADIEIKYSNLKATQVEENEIPLLIDEIPVIALAASRAEGKTIIKGIKELKVKETDRVKSIIDNLRN